LRGVLGRIHDRGAELVIVGNGSVAQAKGFRDDNRITTPVFTDPTLEAYRAAGLRRPIVPLRPQVVASAVRALRAGHRQTRLLGDPLQLGGVFVVEAGGRIRYSFIARDAGDHPLLDEVLAHLP